MRLVDADKLMECYENTPECNIDDCSVSIPVIRQNIRDMQTINPYEWISVEDKLPEVEKDVLVYLGNAYNKVCGVYEYLGYDEWRDEYCNKCYTEDEGVTHWMPLPTLPTEKEN